MESKLRLVGQEFGNILPEDNYAVLKFEDEVTIFLRGKIFDSSSLDDEVRYDNLYGSIQKESLSASTIISEQEGKEICELLDYYQSKNRAA